MMPTLALLDGHSLAYRAFYALPEDLQTRSGQVTNAVYGFTRMLLKLMGDHRPDAVAVAWDTGRETFRTEEYGEYKAQREAAPDRFKSQLPLIREVLDALGIPQIERAGYEADDVIASIADHAVREGWKVLVVTGDRDAFQLVDEDIQVLYTRRGISDTVLADAAYVEERYGVTPDRYPDYAALRGDTSDNLPGVPGVGEKTAARLIATYGSLEGIYEHLDDMTPKLRENLEASKEQVFLNRRLMRLVRDLDVEWEAQPFDWSTWDREKTKRLFESLEFHAPWEELLRLVPAEAAAGEIMDVETTVATSPEAVQAAVEEATTSGPLALHPVFVDEEPAGVAIAVDAGRAVYVPAERIDALTPVLADPTVPKVAHDAKDLARALLARGASLEGLVFDTAIAAYLLNPAARSYRLEDVAPRYVGLELDSPDTEAATAADDRSGQGAFVFEEPTVDVEAAGRRAVAVAALAERLEEELEARDELTLFREIEVPLVPVLARMEHVGIGVDRAYLEELGETLRDKLATLERRIHEAAGGPFNINSTLQLREVLFDKLGLPVLKKTAKGAPSTDASVLAKLADQHPIVAMLLEYREYEKLRSTYVDGYLPLIGPDGRIHARFNQMGSTTGRLSSENPNLQNIPVRSETGRLIRRAFVPREGWTFVVADYSQIELRVLAHMSGDPGLLEAFTGEQDDIHTATAARVFGVEPEHVTPQMRRMAKAINFGLLYGMEAYGLAERLEISRDEAKTHIEAYFEQFPKVSEFMRSVVEEAKARGYTETLFGRRRYLPELKSDNFRIRQMGERMALNAPIQGTAADIIKKAMIELDRRLAERDMETTMLLQVHDELVLEAPPEELEDAAKLIVSVMEGVADLRVPLRVELATGANLAECK